MNRILKLIIINFLLGGFAVAFFVTIAETVSYGLVGNLVGALPIMTTYMIFYSYLNSEKENTTSMVWQGSISAIIYIIFNVAFALIYPKLKNVYGSYFSALGIWLLCQIILIMYILPKCGVKLLIKDK